MKGRGWHGESRRHGLARRGIRTVPRLIQAKGVVGTVGVAGVVPAGTQITLSNGTFIYFIGEPRKKYYTVAVFPPVPCKDGQVSFQPEQIHEDEIKDFINGLGKDIQTMVTKDEKGDMIRYKFDKKERRRAG